MTERAQKVMDALLKYTEHPEYVNEWMLSNALRELLSVFDDWGGDEYSNEVFREICEIANELEAL
jgi:hypothetical protein